MPQGRLNRWRWVAAQLLVALALLAGLELAARLVIHLRHGVPGKSYGIYNADRELGAVHRPNSYNTNSVINNWGFRNPNDISAEKPAGALRVYCSGGSTTFCYNLRTEEAWPVLLQTKLRELSGHSRDEVLNAGEICFAVSQELVLARRFILKLKPDVVILYGTGVNEILSAGLLWQEGHDFDELLAKGRWGICPRNLDQARFLKRNSTLVRLYDYYFKKWFLQARARHIREQPQAPSDPHPWVEENFRRILTEYIRFLRENGCQVIMVRFPDNGEDSWHMRYVRRLREEAVSIARDQGASVCDIAADFENFPAERRRGLFIETGLHVTREGARIVAEALRSFLQKQPSFDRAQTHTSGSLHGEGI